MKRLELNIESCIECPFVCFDTGTEFDDDTRYCYCDHLEGHMDEVQLRNRDGTIRDMTGYIHPECPLPNMPDRLEQSHIPSSIPCPRCKSSNTVHENMGMCCLDCKYRFGSLICCPKCGSNRTDLMIHDRIMPPGTKTIYCINCGASW